MNECNITTIILKLSRTNTTNIMKQILFNNHTSRNPLLNDQKHSIKIQEDTIKQMQKPCEQIRHQQNTKQLIEQLFKNILTCCKLFEICEIKKKQMLEMSIKII